MDILILLSIIVFLIGFVAAYFFGQKMGMLRKQKEWEDVLPSYRKDAIMRSRSILGGQFSEQLSPFLPNFKYLPTECRFMGKPIDLIVFKGMDNKNIDEVVFVEIKSGNSKLTSSEKKLKETIKNGKVRWEEYRIPESLTKREFD